MASMKRGLYNCQKCFQPKKHVCAHPPDPASTQKIPTKKTAAGLVCGHCDVPLKHVCLPGSAAMSDLPGGATRRIRRRRPATGEASDATLATPVEETGAGERVAKAVDDEAAEEDDEATEDEATEDEEERDDTSKQSAMRKRPRSPPAAPRYFLFASLLTVRTHTR